jgi:hypothetical protein
MLAFNRGEHGRGFALCTRCGFAESETKIGEGRVDLPKGFDRHAPLWLERTAPCWDKGEAPVMRNLRMAAIHVTDLIQLDFTDVVHHGVDCAVFTWGHALKLAGAELLEIDHRELGVVFGPVGAAARIGVQLFDNTAGGAGHVLELANDGDQWVRRAMEVMYRDAPHHAACETACLNCLLTAASQSDFEAGRLRRKPAYAVMSELLSGVGGGSRVDSLASKPKSATAGARAEAFRKRAKLRVSAAVEGLVAQADPSAHDVILACSRNAWPLPEVGFEPVGGDGVIVGMIELAWPHRLVAAVTPEQEQFGEILKRVGWTIFSLPAAESDLRKHLGKE